MKKLLLFALSLSLSLSFVGCSTPPNAPSSSDVAPVVLKVGASPAPHAEILQEAQALLKEKNITLEIVEFTDYVLPNTALEAGELDANFFQHKPYLETFNTRNETHIVPVVGVHFEPLGIYPGKSKDLKAIPQKAVISVPSDESNQARALVLLEAQGILKLKEGVGLSATPLDIVENPYEVEIVELEAVQLTATLADVDFAVINGNYAVDADITDLILVSEDAQGEAGQLYGNILAVKEGNDTRPEIQTLAEVLTGDALKQFIETRYEGLFLPVF